MTTSIGFVFLRPDSVIGAKNLQHYLAGKETLRGVYTEERSAQGDIAGQLGVVYHDFMLKPGNWDRLTAMTCLLS